MLSPGPSWPHFNGGPNLQEGAMHRVEEVLVVDEPDYQASDGASRLGELPSVVSSPLWSLQAPVFQDL